MIMTINKEATHTTSDNTPWQSLTVLADKMGELGTTSPEEDLEVSRHEFLNLIDVLDDNTTTVEEREALTAKWNSSSNSKKVWSREFIDSIKEKVGEDVAAYELMEFGMPAKFILENEDYYSEMIEDGSGGGYFSLPPGTFSDFYYAMQATEDDKSKFQKDFIESGLAQKYVSNDIRQILQHGQHDDSIIADLKIAKSFGMSMLNENLYTNGEKQEREQAGQDLANFLNDNGLLDGKDVASVYEKILSRGFFQIEEFGIINVAIKEGIEIETDDPNAEYWHSLSLQQKSKENMLHKFVNGIIFESEMIQKSFDFAQEPVMRAFVCAENYATGDYIVSSYQTPQFREALRQPAFQDIIMQALEEKQRGDHPFAEGKVPSLFLMLAQDRQILVDMRTRGAFDRYEKCKEIEAIGKISSGDYDERYRLSLFLDEEYLTSELFDEQGEPNDDFMRKMSSWDDKYRGFVGNSYFLDSRESDRLSSLQKAINQLDELIISAGYGSFAYGLREGDYDFATFLNYFDKNGPKPEFWQKCLESKEYNFLSRLDDETKAKMGFDENTMGFLNSLGTLSGSRLIQQLDPASITEYFDKNGPKPEFWQKSFESKDYSLIADQDEETKAKMGFDESVMSFINGAAGNVFKDSEKTIDSQNIIAALTRFIKMDADDWMRATEDDLVVKEAFSGNETKDLAFQKLMGIYEGYLNSDEETKVPQILTALSDYMHENDGAGPLSQIEAFLDFAGGLSKLDEEGRILTRDIEKKMSKNRYDNQEKANFYAISAEVIQADPEIYREFTKLFVNIPDKRDFQAFTTEIYPLYRAKLALLRDYEDHSDGIGSGYTSVNYRSVDLDELRNQLHNALLPFNLQEDAERRQKGIDRVKEIILGEISGLFQSKFGLLPEAIPQEFDKPNTKAIEAMTLYLGNLARPTEQKKDIIGYFLALQFDKSGVWDKMRSGAEVSPSGFMNVVSSFNVQKALETSKANTPLTSANLKIEDPERRSAFCRALQSDTGLLRVSDTNTIDLKLQNLIGNIEELTDPDLYPEAIDRQKVALLKEFSPKLIGKVAAGMFQRLNGRDIPVLDGEQEVIDRMTSILSDNNLEMTPENIKVYFQDGLKGLKEPFSVLEKSSGATQAIEELQDLLIPPDDIIQIFNRLGENFSTQSGVLALSADLDFLENLASKKENEMSDEEAASVKSYIESIREKMSELYDVYEKAVQNFQKMQKSIHDSSPTSVKDKIGEIERIIASSGEQSNMTITCTTDMTTIINNMRACLSCKTKGINNDTDLTFGEGYKFFLYSTMSANKSSSSSDEIVFFVPVGEGEEKRMSFVMDQIYGIKNRDTLVGHVETILKKARALKSQFPEIPISVTIPNSTLASCGTSLDASEATNLGLFSLSETNRIINLSGEIIDVPVSGFGDHYIEFGGEARSAGSRQVSGIEIKL